MVASAHCNRVHRFERFRFKHNLYKLREERHMKPCTFGQMVSATLYEKRCAHLAPPSLLVWARSQLIRVETELMVHQQVAS